jgi:hypothetical protein
MRYHRINKPTERAPRSLPARFPPAGAWPAEMRADLVAAFFDFKTTGELYKAILRAEAPRPTAFRRRDGRREPVWALEACRSHVANRHEIASDAAPARTSIVDLI